MWIRAATTAGNRLEAAGEDRVDLSQISGGHRECALSIPFPVNLLTASTFGIEGLAVEHR